MSVPCPSGRILLVEDEIAIALYGSMLLEEAGYEVELAADGRRGLDLARTRRPDAIVTDFMMPKLDGIAMLRALAEEGSRPPAVVVSAVPRAQLSGGDQDLFEAYLQKPYVEAELIDTICRCLNHGGFGRGRTGVTDG